MSGNLNSDELVPPSFLTQDYFQEVLREIEKDPELKVNGYFSSLIILTFCNLLQSFLPAPELCCQPRLKCWRPLCEHHSEDFGVLRDEWMDHS